MSRFDAFIRRFNFKRAASLFLISSVLAGIFSAGFLAYQFRDKLAFAYGYHRINEQAGREKGGFESLEPELDRLAAASPDLVDILILDGKNRILFSAKNSDLSKEGSLDLAAGSGEKADYLTDAENPNVHFRLTENDKLAFSLELLGIEEKAEQDYEDRYFYEKDYNLQKMYLLSYLADRASGNKVYFVSDARPVAGGKFYLKAAAVLAMLLFMIYWVLLALWVYAQALKSKLNAPLWGLAALFTNLAGWLVFLLYRQGRQTCYKCGALQNRSNAYCTFCGTKLGSVCEKCHMPGDGRDRYCRYCGSALNGEKEQDE